MVRLPGFCARPIEETPMERLTLLLIASAVIILIIILVFGKTYGIEQAIKDKCTEHGYQYQSVGSNPRAILCVREDGTLFSSKVLP